MIAREEDLHEKCKKKHEPEHAGYEQRRSPAENRPHPSSLLRRVLARVDRTLGTGSARVEAVPTSEESGTIGLSCMFHPGE